jgi:hypothetical protein
VGIGAVFQVQQSDLAIVFMFVAPETGGFPDRVPWPVFADA